jgi:glycerol-3-phosphate acyltransferase PlsY
MDALRAKSRDSRSGGRPMLRGEERAMVSGIVAAALAGYLLGSIPWGMVLTRVAGRGDIRRIGSGNIGATNVLRTGSKALALATLLLDLAKGAAAVGIGALFGREAALAAALAVLIGHMFPVWLGFRGGKGVATGFGILLALAWPVALASALLWLLTALVFQYSSLAALVAAVASAVLAMAFVADRGIVAVIAGVALLVILRHHSNIRRLIAGSESRISLRKG